MDVKQVRLIYFSPTGTTRKVLESIAQGFAAAEVGQVDLTLPAGAMQAVPPISATELVILGAPVYGGRLPAEAIDRFRRLTADRTPAVVVVVYGNREFEDALLELKDLARELGFVPVAAGAFIGEHSFARPDLPIANGRPDRRDDQLARDFGAKISKKLMTLPQPIGELDLAVPGRFPYQGGVRPLIVTPVTTAETCTLCGTCAAVCPTAAVTVQESVTTAGERCIRCSACIKSCPADARSWQDGTMNTIAGWLHEHCATRKEPEIFGL